MINYVLHTMHYLQAPAKYFWRWAAGSEVIEWAGGQTICYRDDLVSILRAMPDDDLPPFGSVLLLITACREPVTMGKEYFLLRIAKEMDDKEISATLDKAVRFLHVVYTLPEELRTGNARTHLLQEVFLAKRFLFKSITARDIMDDLTSGRLTATDFFTAKVAEKHHFLQDLQPLADALDKFPTPEALAMQLRTGVTQVPAPREKEIPELPPAELLDDLAGDPATAGLARLTRMLIAAFNIPMHSRGSGDQSWGGITDITNRGNYDKLLLSELAQDTDVLTARLVNNEALYFRREQPPDQPTLQRTILIDTTLKMWGIPRVFAMSAALAFAWHVRRESVVEVFTLGGRSYTSANITTKAGVIAALSQLDHALHCGIAVEKIISEKETDLRNEYILITDQHLFSDAGFQACYSRVKKEIAFVITLGRDGEIRFYSSSTGGLKQIARARPDLEQLLFAPEQGMNNSSRLNKLEPEQLENLSGLYFPAVGIKTGRYGIFRLENGGVLAITETNRLLYWRNRQHGAEEILNNIESGQVYFGVLEKDTASILVRGDKGEIRSVGDNRMHYQLYFKEGAYQRMTITPAPGITLGIENNYGYFYIRESIKPLSSSSGRESRSFINNGYSTLIRFEKIGIDGDGNLLFNSHALQLTDGNHFKLISLHPKRTTFHIKAELQDDHVFTPPFTQTKMQFWQWPDGSALLTDNRGFIHFISANQELPLFTMVSVIGKQTSFYAENREAAGSGYFINDKGVKLISTQEFNSKYVESYISQIVNSCS